MAKKKALTPSEFLDKLQEGIVDALDGTVDWGEKLKAITAGISLAKVRGAISDEDDGDTMGFPQR